MEYRQVVYFLEVAKHLNFSKAAKQLFISQPALSQQIAELEKEFGIALFVRERQKIYLSEAGKAFLKEAEKIHTTYENAIIHMKQIAMEEGQNHVLRIVLDEDEEHIGTYGIAKAIEKMQSSNRSLKIDLQYLRYPEYLKKIKSDTCDVGFFALRPDEYEQGGYAKKLIEIERLGLATHPSIEGSIPEIIKKYPIVHLINDDRWAEVIQQIVKLYSEEYRIKYISKISQSKEILQVRQAIIPVLKNATLPNSDLKVLDIRQEAVDDRVMISAVWNPENENIWREQLLDML